MEFIQPPKTLKDFQQIRKTICEMLQNPWCDTSMLESLQKRLDEVEDKIKNIYESNEVKTVSEFIEVTGFNIAGKEVVDECIEKFKITDDDLIADIYGSMRI